MIRKLSVSLATGLLFMAVAVSASAQTNFSGTWALDKTKSKDLPSMMADNIETYTITVTQDQKQLTTDTKVTRKEGSAQGAAAGTGAGATAGAGGPGGGGGGGRGRGFGLGNSTATYKLDGSETTAESSGGRPGSQTFKAEWKDGGKSLDLTTVRKFSGPDGEMTLTTKDHWTLSDDGKSLTIDRTSESRRGPQKYTLVFTKQ
jgi:hypothetical protein